MALTPLRATDPTRYGPYTLQGRLGAGGMGVVYLAFGPGEESNDVAVALKVLQPVLAQDEEYRHRFIREVTAAQSVSSPYVARVVDAEIESDALWMATEYIEGATLAHAVEQNGPIPGERLRGLAADLAFAVAALHDAGLVHRDMKPQNVVLAWSGPKLIDFGIAKHEGATELTQAGVTVGSPLWMSPEVLAGNDAGHASDIFGWGLCIAFAGTGRPPFGAGHPNAVAVRIALEPPNLDGLAGDVADLVEASLSKDPAHRPTATELADELTIGAAGSQPVAMPKVDGGWTGPRSTSTRLAPPPTGAPGAPVTESKGSSRNRQAVLAALAVLLTVAAIVLGVYFLQHKDAGSPGGSLTPLTPASSASPTISRATSASPSPTTAPSTRPPTTAPATSTPATTAPTTPPPTTPPPNVVPVAASLAQAKAIVMNAGYEPFADSASNWDPTAPLNVILGTKSGSADGNDNWAYFFAGNTYIGHDANTPSYSLSVFGRTQTTITLSYEVFGPNTPVCCPTLPAVNVTFRYENNTFKALNPIPGTDPNKIHRWVSG